MKELLTGIAIIAALILMTNGGFNEEYALKHAEKKWKDRGFEVVSYEGFQFGSGIRFTDYGGAKVWHSLKKIPDNGITYTGYVQRWGDEVHLYGPTAIDAIRP